MNDLQDIKSAYDALFSYCESEQFAGWDPFDGLNSRLFQATPLRHLAPARLVFLQIVKRSRFNLRPLLKIEKGVNPKGIALFALAELSRFRSDRAPKHEANARKLLAMLDRSRIENGPASWGYNFDWQSRAFFAPKGTPTIVPTAFAGLAFAEAAETLGERAYSDRVTEVCEFITTRLNRPVESETEVCFSYTPIDRSVIFNASLLAAEILAIGNRPGDRELAAKAARFVISRQRDDGAWAYGTKLRHAWIDNFHTAYILLSLDRIRRRVPDLDCDDAISKGLDFWLKSFFLGDGTPKYFDGRTFPIDIHSAAAAVVALSELRNLDPRCLPMAQKVAEWMLENLRAGDGGFYYQKRRSSTVTTPFIRWSNAWTAYALAKLIEACGTESER